MVWFPSAVFPQIMVIYRLYKKKEKTDPFLQGFGAEWVSGTKNPKMLETP